MRRPRVTEFLVKITKYCNLRCRYCNEYRELHNDERMDLEDIRRIFQRIAHYHDADDSEPIIFIWHGGEPFLVPLEIYEAIGQIQKEIFRGKREILNGVQTNLTILTDRHIDILKSGKFFAGLGVSVDPYGNQRVDMRGKLRTNLVFDNMQKLIDHGIEFAAITVLARNTLPYARNSYEFFDRLGIESKFVPFYLESFEQQILEHGLTGAEIAEAMVTIFDTWSASETAAAVRPINDYLDYAIDYMSDVRNFRYNRETDEYSVIINIDGGVWAPNETYHKDYKFGDLLRDDLKDILNSDARQFVIQQSRARQNEYCGQCPYFGACPGFYVADASPQEQRLLSQSGCPVRSVVGHIVEALDRSNLRNIVSKRRATRNVAINH